jgi:glutaconate CoA-transferase, subunit B
VDFITSPGFLRGGKSRRDAGLSAGGMYKVVTDLAILGFDDDDKRMRIEALHPGVSAEQVQANTGFPLETDAAVTTTEPPTVRELAVLRELDPQRLYTA